MDLEGTEVHLHLILVNYQLFKASIRLMCLLVSYTQGVINGDMEPPPEPIEVSLSNPRLKDNRGLPL